MDKIVLRVAVVLLGTLGGALVVFVASRIALLLMIARLLS